MFEDIVISIFESTIWSKGQKSNLSQVCKSWKDLSEFVKIDEVKVWSNDVENFLKKIGDKDLKVKKLFLYVPGFCQKNLTDAVTELLGKIECESLGVDMIAIDIDRQINLLTELSKKPQLKDKVFSLGLNLSGDLAKIKLIEDQIENFANLTSLKLVGIGPDNNFDKLLPLSLKGLHLLRIKNPTNDSIYNLSNRISVLSNLERFSCKAKFTLEHWRLIYGSLPQSILYLDLAQSDKFDNQNYLRCVSEIKAQKLPNLISLNLGKLNNVGKYLVGDTNLLKSLQEVGLNGCEFRGDQVKIFHGATSLKKLDLSNNYLHDHGAIDLAKIIKSSRIEPLELNLKHNHLTIKALAGIANEMNGVDSFPRLDLSDNKFNPGKMLIIENIEDLNKLVDQYEKYDLDRAIQSSLVCNEKLDFNTRRAIEMSENDSGRLARQEARGREESDMKEAIRRSLAEDQGKFEDNPDLVAGAYPKEVIATLPSNQFSSRPKKLDKTQLHGAAFGPVARKAPGENNLSNGLDSDSSDDPENAEQDNSSAIPEGHSDRDISDKSFDSGSDSSIFPERDFERGKVKLTQDAESQTDCPKLDATSQAFVPRSDAQTQTDAEEISADLACKSKSAAVRSLSFGANVQQTNPASMLNSARSQNLSKKQCCIIS